MATTLAVVKTQTPRSKPKRERIALIEATPNEEWFVRTTSHADASSGTCALK